MKTTPLHQLHSFTLTITEEDRQNADNYGNNCSCLIATALKRLGAKDVNECVNSASIDGVWFNHTPAGIQAVQFDNVAAEHDEKPLYKEPVVGRVFQFWRAASQ